MNERHLPSPATYNLRKSLRDQLPRSDDSSLDEIEDHRWGLLDNPDLQATESEAIFRDLVNSESIRRRRNVMDKLEPIDEFLGISFRTKVNGVLISTKPIYFSPDDATYETYIDKADEESLDVVVHGTDPDVQPAAVRKAKKIHEQAVTLAEQGLGIRAIRDAVVSMLS